MTQLLKTAIFNYLRFLSQHFIKKNEIDIIGLTGSAGKSTLTLALCSVLSKKYKTLSTFQKGKGLNSGTGIPFAMLDVEVHGYSLSDWLKYLATATLHFFTLQPDYSKFVIEMGVDKPGDMEFLTSFIKPKIAIFLSFSPVHVSNFEKEAEKLKTTPQQLLFDEKAKIFKRQEENNWALLNYDNPDILALRDTIKSKVFTFGFHPQADLKVLETEYSIHGFKFTVEYQGQTQTFTIKNYLGAEGITSTLLAAIAVGLISDIPFHLISEGIKEMVLPQGRMSLLRGIENTTLIDSSYNASPIAMNEALDILNHFKDKEKIAVLGDMRELGRSTQKYHEELAHKVKDVADKVFTIGESMEKYFIPELKEIAPRFKVYSFTTAGQALKTIREQINGGEVILIKGSQNTIFTEIVVEDLLANPADSQLLCRRGAYWDKERAPYKKN